jgi:hypothetical protein
MTMQVILALMVGARWLRSCMHPDRARKSS